jgi:hypothetical protein
VLPRLAAVLLLLAGAQGCIRYEFEHEFWLRVDGSGSVRVTGRPGLWAAFKNISHPDADDGSLQQAARLLFEASGLQVRRVTLTRRGGERYLFVAADFKDVNRLWGSPAFPDLRIHLVKEGERLRLKGDWFRPLDSPEIGDRDREGTAAVRFHLPSKLYEHENAANGVERGNIVSWRQPTAEALLRRPLEFGALMDSRSILWSTLGLFGSAIALALLLLGGALWLVFRKGRRAAGA